MDCKQTRKSSLFVLRNVLAMAFDAPTWGILGTSFGAVDVVDSQAREAAQVVKKYLEQHQTFKLPGPKF